MGSSKLPPAPGAIQPGYAPAWKILYFYLNFEIKSNQILPSVLHAYIEPKNVSNQWAILKKVENQKASLGEGFGSNIAYVARCIVSKWLSVKRTKLFYALKFRK